MSESDSVLFNVNINNYNGPLDALLDLAKAQKVDLEQISITKLADQFHDYITKKKGFKSRNCLRILVDGYVVSISKI